MISKIDQNLKLLPTSSTFPFLLMQSPQCPQLLRSLAYVPLCLPKIEVSFLQLLLFRVKVFRDSRLRTYIRGKSISLIISVRSHQSNLKSNIQVQRFQRLHIYSLKHMAQWLMQEEIIVSSFTPSITPSITQRYYPSRKIESSSSTGPSHINLFCHPSGTLSGVTFVDSFAPILILSWTLPPSLPPISSSSQFSLHQQLCSRSYKPPWPWRAQSFPIEQYPAALLP